MQRVTYASEEPGMPATTINFVRHGKVYNPDHLLYDASPDFHLSERGRRSGAGDRRYIAQSPQLNTAVAVYSSPLDRTRETANEILLELNKVRAERGQEALGLLTDERIIEAGNEFRGTRIGHGEGALWKPRESQARAQSVDAKLGRELPLDRRSRAGFRTRKGARIPG